MSRARSTVLICVILVVLAAAFVVVYIRARQSDEPNAIVLPEQGSDLSPAAPDDVVETGFTGVTPENVRDIISVISPAVSYSRTFTVTTAWSDGSGIDIVDVCCLGELLRISVDHRGETRHIIYRDDEYWLWYSDSDDITTGDAGSFAAHAEARIPDYRELIDSSPDSIVDADYRELNDMICIYLRLALPDGYSELWIDLGTGLLVRATETQAGAVVYEMQQTAIETPMSSMDDVYAAFTLPDGTLLYS